jgi:hypothetical protein
LHTTPVKAFVVLFAGPIGVVSRRAVITWQLRPIRMLATARPIRAAPISMNPKQSLRIGRTQRIIIYIGVELNTTTLGEESI